MSIEKFLKKLKTVAAKAKYKFRIEKLQIDRPRIRSKCENMCPMAVVCLDTKKQHLKNWQSIAFAQHLGLTHEEVAEVMRAADYSDRSPELRKQLLKAVGLKEAKRADS